MKELFKEYLFEKHVLVNDLPRTDASVNPFYALFAFANKLGVEITKGKELADISLVRFASEMIGVCVPEPFYRGFPETVKSLTQSEKLLDQLFHYFITYQMGDFEEAGHSIFESEFKKTAFREGYEVKKLEIVTEESAEALLKSYVLDMAKSSRPLSEEQYEVLMEAIHEYDYCDIEIGSLNTTVKLIYDLQRTDLADQIKLSDIIKLVEHVAHENCQRSLKKLNLKNADRKLITGCIKRIFNHGKCDIRACYEKKDLWCGLLHHLHYKPETEEEELFLKAMRGKDNKSVYSEFECLISKKDIKGAIKCLKKSKGNGAILRNLDYIASRCEDEKELVHLVKSIDECSPILLIQLLNHYSFYAEEGARTFYFVKNGLMKSHTETDSEQQRRKTYLDQKTREVILAAVREKLAKSLCGKLDKVYIDKDAKKIALPLQEATSNGGYGVLSKGSRISIDTSKIVRAFTYWSKVNDIDLSCFTINEDGSTKEFSWRTISYGAEQDFLVFSGDQTSGFYGGSEYFDVDMELLKKEEPDARYIVFCDNVFSGVNFSEVECRAGYMIREKMSSGEVFEPKTVKSAYSINCQSIFAYMFAIDLVSSELVWLNLSNDLCYRVAGDDTVAKVMPYVKALEVISLYDFAKLCAKEIVEDASEADIVFSDRELTLKEGAEQIHSYDFERILALLN